MKEIFFLIIIATTHTHTHTHRAKQIYMKCAHSGEQLCLHLERECVYMCV